MNAVVVKNAMIVGSLGERMSECLGRGAEIGTYFSWETETSEDDYGWGGVGE